jgi:hypothetical protein
MFSGLIDLPANAADTKCSSLSPLYGVQFMLGQMKRALKATALYNRLAKRELFSSYLKQTFNRLAKRELFSSYLKQAFNLLYTILH